MTDIDKEVLEFEHKLGRELSDDEKVELRTSLEESKAEAPNEEEKEQIDGIFIEVVRDGQEVKPDKIVISGKVTSAEAPTLLELSLKEYRKSIGL